MGRTIDKAKADYAEQHWEDKGCEFVSSCLNPPCRRPRNKCPMQYSHIFLKDKKQRQTAVIISRLAEGQSKEFICEQMKISPSTIQRALRGKI